jgi:hypothetical protein
MARHRWPSRSQVEALDLRRQATAHLWRGVDVGVLAVILPRSRALAYDKVFGPLERNAARLGIPTDVFHTEVAARICAARADDGHVAVFNPASRIRPRLDAST